MVKREARQERRGKWARAGRSEAGKGGRSSKGKEIACENAGPEAILPLAAAARARTTGNGACAMSAASLASASTSGEGASARRAEGRACACASVKEPIAVQAMQRDEHL